MHDVGEVHPLVAITIPVLGRIGLRARYLANTHSLRMVRAHQHGRLPVPRRAGLGAEPASVQVAAAGLRVAHTGLHDVDGSTGLVVTLLDIGEQALNFLMSRGGRHVGQVGRVDVLHV